MTKDVHTEHCCARHGCKYNWDSEGQNCSVVRGEKPQSFPCEQCEYDGCRLRELILEYARLEPCHITGMHDPTHTTKAICQDQLKHVLVQLLETAGLTPEELPRQLHKDCWSCHNVPPQEELRIQRRALHEWAGVPVPDELAALAEDALHPGDVEKVIAALHTLLEGGDDGWIKIGTVNSWIQLILFGRTERDPHSLQATRSYCVRENLILNGLMYRGQHTHLHQLKKISSHSCQGCGKPAVHLDGVGGACADCFKIFFPDGTESRTDPLGMHRQACKGACKPMVLTAMVAERTTTE